MSRRTRAFRPWSAELEGRLLLTTRPAALRSVPRGDSVFFGWPPGAPAYAMQRDASITVPLALRTAIRAKPMPSFQVLVETDPSSPAVGVNVGAVRQLITIEQYMTPDPVIVPILSGAPNPGVVDVTLTITPINPPPRLKVGPPLHLKVLASEDFLPPRIETMRVTPRAILLKFSKPMDPAGASNLNNYAVKATGRWSGGGGGGSGSMYSLENFLTSLPSLFEDDPSPPASTYLKFHSAQYDPETRTVTLVPRRKLRPRAATISVSERQPGGPGGRADGPEHGPLLTDLRGQRLDNMNTPATPPAFLLPSAAPAAPQGLY